MGLWTTYLAFLRKADYNPLKVFPNELKETLFKYVMRNRGNNEVAPEDWLKPYLKLRRVYNTNEEKAELWKQYKENYLTQIGLSEKARNWMQDIANLAKKANIVLICFEKDGEYCHRTLLANEIARRFPHVDYRGELTEEAFSR